MRKTGIEIDASDVISKGNRMLHSVEALTLNYENLKLEVTPLDSPLLAPGSPAFWDYHDELPDPAKGPTSNFFNNQWGTNFPMWFEGEFTSRFLINILPK